MAVSEVEVDTLTGYVRHLRTDILHDVGESINPRIDIGQVEGAYIQGLGWCTTEEVKHDANGNLLNHSPTLTRSRRSAICRKIFGCSCCKAIQTPCHPT